MPDVENRNQVRRLQVHAVADAAQLDVLVILHGLQRDLAAGITERVIHFPEPTAAERMLDRVPVEWSLTVIISI